MYNGFKSSIQWVVTIHQAENFGEAILSSVIHQVQHRRKSIGLYSTTTTTAVISTTESLKIYREHLYNNIYCGSWILNPHAFASNQPYNVILKVLKLFCMMPLPWASISIPSFLFISFIEPFPPRPGLPSTYEFEFVYESWERNDTQQGPEIQAIYNTVCN